jgi:hypothetical protein
MQKDAMSMCLYFAPKKGHSDISCFSCAGSSDPLDKSTYCPDFIYIILHSQLSLNFL